MHHNGMFGFVWLEMIMLSWIFMVQKRTSIPTNDMALLQLKMLK